MQILPTYYLAKTLAGADIAVSFFINGAEICLPCESDSENILVNLIWTGIAGSWPGGISWALVEADVTSNEGDH